MTESIITIGGRAYRKNTDVDRFQIAVTELDDLALGDIPCHSHLEILGVLPDSSELAYELYVVNGGELGDWEYLSAYGGADLIVPGPSGRTAARFRRAFRNLPPHARGLIQNPHVSEEPTESGTKVSVYVHLDFPRSPERLVREAILPLVDGIQRLQRPDIRVFICYASEDKPAARSLAAHLRTCGADVWFDEWEVQVGDSIVEKVNAALGMATHLVILLSKDSVTKSWVAREFSSALMRQLADASIRLLPIRLDESRVPPLLADLRYADGRGGIRDAFPELERGLFGDYSAPGA